MPATTRRIRISPVDREGAKLALTQYPGHDNILATFLRSIPGREWNKAYKLWVVPGAAETLLFIRDHKPADCALTIDDAVKARFRIDIDRLAGAHDVKLRGDSEIEHAYVTEPYAHQRAGLQFLTELGSGALLWEMGLGKTKTAIDYAEWLARREVVNEVGLHGTPNGDIRVLVICPNTIKRNWLREIAMHAGHDDALVLDGSIAKRIGQLGQARYSIVNCEALSIATFAKALLECEWDLVIVDESTRFKTHNAARTKALLALVKHAQRRVILTGTPITGSPEDAWAQFEFIQPGIFGRHYAFVDQFVERDYFGNAAGVKEGMESELARRIGRRSYRVLKSQVLDLPPKVYADRVVELTKVQAEAYRQMRDELRIEIDNLPEVNAFNVLTRLLRLTQVTAGLVGESPHYQWIPDNAKVTELDNLLNDELRGEQVVIFGIYQAELEALAQRYQDKQWTGTHYAPDPRLGIIYGPTPEKVRHELIEQFQAGDRRLLFAQVRTGGIGITLTAARTAIFYSRSWSLEEYLQAQDRLHRIGQTGTVSIVHLTAKGTIDEAIAKSLAAKQSLADQLTGDDARRLAVELMGGITA